MITSVQHFRNDIRALDGVSLETDARRSKFMMRITDSGIEITPESTRRARTDSWGSIDSVVERFIETRSFSPKDYHDISFNSSYIIAILRRMAA